MTDYSEVFNFVPDRAIEEGRSANRANAAKARKKKIADSIKKRVEVCAQALGHAIGPVELDLLAEMAGADRGKIKALLINDLGYIESGQTLIEPPF